jgi:hypothetical protein
MRVGVRWGCDECGNECVPVRDESRCLCGHRLKEHAKPSAVSGAGSSTKCGHARCVCKRFFYIVAEGAWVLRCQCKHKHTQHHPVTRACVNPACGCDGFVSPWVCNCDHPWVRHSQSLVEKRLRSLADMIPGLDSDTALAADLGGWDGIRRGEGVL